MPDATTAPAPATATPAELPDWEEISREPDFRSLSQGDQLTALADWSNTATSLVKDAGGTEADLAQLSKRADDARTAIYSSSETWRAVNDLSASGAFGVDLSDRTKEALSMPMMGTQILAAMGKPDAWRTPEQRAITEQADRYHGLGMSGESIFQEGDPNWRPPITDKKELKKLREFKSAQLHAIAQQEPDSGLAQFVRLSDSVLPSALASVSAASAPYEQFAPSGNPVAEAFGRSVASNTGGALGGAAGVALGVALAPESGGLSLLLPLLTGYIGSVSGSQSQEGITQLTETPEETAARHEQLAQDAAEHPVATTAGGLAANLPYFRPSPTQMLQTARAVGYIRLGAEVPAAEAAALKTTLGAFGIGAGQHVATNTLTGQPVTLEDTLTAGAEMAFFSKPTALGEAMGLGHEPLEATARLRALAEERAKISARIVNDRLATKPGDVSRLAQVNSEIKNEAQAAVQQATGGDNASTAPEAAATAGAGQQAPAAPAAAESKPVEPAAPAQPQTSQRLTDALADLEWARGTGDPVEIASAEEGVRLAREAAAAPAAQEGRPAAPGSEAPAEPEKPATAPVEEQGGAQRPLFNERRDLPANETPRDEAERLRRELGDEEAAKRHGLTPENVKDFYNGTNETGVNPNGYGQDGLTMELESRIAEQRKGATPPESGSEPSAPAGESAPVAEAPAPEPATSTPEPKTPTPLTAEQHQKLEAAVRAAADRFQWRNEAEKDGHSARVLSEVEARASKWLAEHGSLDDFSASLVAMSRFRDAVRTIEAQRTTATEDTASGNSEGGGGAHVEAVAEERNPHEQAAYEDAKKSVRGAVASLEGDERRIMEAQLADPEKPLSEIADDLGIQEDKARRLFKSAAEKLRAKLKGEREAMLHLQIIPGLHEFIRQDVTSAVSGLISGSVKAFRQMRAILAPASAGDGADISAGLGREGLAVLARKFEVASAALHGARKAFDRMAEPLRLDFIDRMENGRAQATPELNALARQLRSALAERVREVRRVNPNALQNLIQNYFPHIWKDPSAATTVYEQIFSRRPLEGPKSFLKKRSIPTTVDGINRGLEPVSTNPVTLTLLKLREMDRYVMARDWVNELKGQRLMQLVRTGAKPPVGWAKIDDRIAQVWQRNQGAGGGLILRGQYYAPEGAARIINNHLSPGLKGNVVYDVFRGAGNLMNQVQLGMSGFHALFVSLDAATSKAALGVVQIGRGQVFRGAANVLQGVAGNIFTNPLQAMIKGSRVLKEYYRPGSIGGEVGTVVEALMKAGGRVKMDEFYQTGAVKSFQEALRTGNYPGALIRSPLAAVELTAKPILEFLVPRMKAGVFFDLAQEELRFMRQRGVTDSNEVRARLGKVWDSVDNRMGQLVYDNVFWHRMLKDGLMASVRSVGWNLGDIRELAGGAVDTLALPARLRRDGLSGAVTHRMGYLVALPFTVGALGALYQYLHTGQAPGQRKKQDGTEEYAGSEEAIRDMFLPRTGRTLPDGSPERIQVPSYVKDIAAYRSHPLDTLKHKLHPLLGTVADMVTNHDYYGTEIVNADDPLVQKLKDEAEYVAKQFRPFTLQAANRREGDDTLTKVESFMGLQPPPAERLRTPAMNKLMDFTKDSLPQFRSKADAQSAEMRRDAKKQIRTTIFADEKPGSMDDVKKIAKAALGQKMIAKKDFFSINGAIENGTVTTVDDALALVARKADARVALFKHLSLDKAQRVFNLGTQEERELWKPVLELKEKDAKKKAAKEKAAAPVQGAAAGN